MNIHGGGIGIPMLAATVVMSPRVQIADDAVTAAQSPVHLAHPEQLRSIGDDIAACWERLLLQHHGHAGPDLESLVRRTLAEHGVLPTQVYERLTAAPVAS